MDRARRAQERPADYEPVYKLAAMKMGTVAPVNHVVSGAISPDGSFLTVCGRIGTVDSYHIGEMHTGYGTWCKRCRR